jgi:3-methyl-2-oxobutanoate hydroxymethyltransferase
MMTPEGIRATKGARRLAMLTAYDYPTAMALDHAGVDLILVGDSVAMVELGYPTTREATLAMMCHHVRAVRAGAVHTHIVGDMPVGTYETRRNAVGAARALVDAGADSVKLEGARIAQVEAIIAAGIAVMGHVGLQPQTAEVYRKEGTTPDAADRITAEAVALEVAECFAIVIEAVPADLGTRITHTVSVPTIGIAAGRETDGQVLVSTDLVGQLPVVPPFVSPQANVFGIVVDAARAFVEDVHNGASVPDDVTDTSPAATWPTVT